MKDYLVQPDGSITESVTTTLTADDIAQLIEADNVAIHNLQVDIDREQQSLDGKKAQIAEYQAHIDLLTPVKIDADKAVAALAVSAQPAKVGP